MAGEKKSSELLSRSVPTFPSPEDSFGLGLSFHSESPKDFRKRVWGTQLNNGGPGFFHSSPTIESLTAYASSEEEKKKEDDFQSLLEESKQQALRDAESPTVRVPSPFAIFQKLPEVASAESSIEPSVPPTPTPSPFAAFSKTS